MTRTTSQSTGAGVAIAGAALGITALAVTLAARQAEKRHPPRGTFVEVDGVRLHYLEEGSGPPVVLLHGNGAMATDFKASGLLDALAATHRVVAFDRPGFGYSERPRGRSWSATDQADLLSKAFGRLGMTRPLVVGHSWGTLVALALALDHPARVSGLVLMAGYYYPTVRLDALMMSGPAIPVIGDVMRFTVSPLVGKAIAGRVVRKLFSPAVVSPAFEEAVPEGLMLRPGQLKASAAESVLMMKDADDLSSRYRELRMPIAVIAGDHDKVIDHEEQSARFCREFPHAGLTLLPGAGHMLHYAGSARVLQIIHDLDRQVRASGGNPGNAEIRPSV